MQAEELPERGHEVPGRQAVQVQQRQHLADLRGLARPRRQDRRRGGPRAVPGGDGAAGLRMPNSAIATSLEEAVEALPQLGLPAIVRPAFTLGGRGGGIAHTDAELQRVVARGLEASPIGQVLVEESVLGWGEFELEVMRDRADNVVIVCSIENLDPMGVHTGDSVDGRAAADADRPRSTSGCATRRSR